MRKNHGIGIAGSELLTQCMFSVSPSNLKTTYYVTTESPWLIVHAVLLYTNHVQWHH